MRTPAYRIVGWVLCLFVLPSVAQKIDWKLDNLREVSGNVRNLSTQDRLGGLASLDLTDDDVRVEQLRIASGRLFLVQGVGSICGANNCDFWILDEHYKVLLQKVTQSFELQPTVHNGLPDVVTSMHGSAFSSSLSYWKFNGRRYLRSACAGVVYGDLDGKPYKKPHISMQRCGTRG